MMMSNINQISYTTSIVHVLQGMLSYFHHFGIFVWMGENNNLNMLNVDVYFFKNEGKNLHFQKYWDVCGQGLNYCFYKGQAMVQFRIKNYH